MTGIFSNGLPIRLSVVLVRQWYTTPAGMFYVLARGP